MGLEVIESQGLQSFEGVVEKVELQPATSENRNDQYKITIATAVSKKSGKMYEWVGLSATANDKQVPEGSSLHRYLQELWTVVPETKKLDTVGEQLKAMTGKKFRFVRKVLGKSFTDGSGVKHEAKESWVPQALL